MAQDVSSPQPKAQDLAQAPYRQYPNGPSGHYMIRFNKHYDIKQHFQFLDRDFPCQTYHISSQVFGYHADLVDEDLVRLVRSDPGVKEIEDDHGETLSREWPDTRRARGRQTAPIVPIEGYEALYRRSPEGPTGRYLVFFQPGHSVREHFRIIGRGFALWEFQIINGYCARMDDELLAIVRQDSGVKMVEDDLANAAAEPQFPIYSYDDKPCGRNLDIILQPGYTVPKHFAFLGFRYADREPQCHRLISYRFKGFGEQIWEPWSYSDSDRTGYQVHNLEDDQFMAVMRDPGVHYVDQVEYVDGEDGDDGGFGLFD